MTNSSVKCPSCGAAATGKFCNNCGTALSRPECPACGTPVRPGNPFCHGCGAPAPLARSPAGGMGSSKLWIVAGGLAVIVALVAVVWSTAARPPAATPASSSQVDLSMMTPQQQADSLFNRVMWAHQRGEYAEVATFAPRAIEAYRGLGKLSNDARYHVGVLYSVGGPMEMALVHADSLEAGAPGHLFSALLRGGVARVQGDTAALHNAYRAFLENYDSEMESGRTEYQDHATSIQAFLTEARSGLGTADGTD